MADLLLSIHQAAPGRDILLSQERIGRMLQMHSNNREDIKEAYAGDIVALAGLSLGLVLLDAARTYDAEVKGGQFPGAEHTF